MGGSRGAVDPPPPARLAIPAVHAPDPLSSLLHPGQNPVCSPLPVVFNDMALNSKWSYLADLWIPGLDQPLSQTIIEKGDCRSEPSFLAGTHGANMTHFQG